MEGIHEQEVSYGLSYILFVIEGKTQYMYNKILLPFLDDDPRKTITPFGVKIRKVLFPLLKTVIPLTVKRKLIVVSARQNPKQPIILMSTYEFRENCEAAYNAAGVSAYLANGSVSVVMNSFDGFQIGCPG